MLLLRLRINRKPHIRFLSKNPRTRWVLAREVELSQLVLKVRQSQTALFLRQTGRAFQADSPASAWQCIDRDESSVWHGTRDTALTSPLFSQITADCEICRMSIFADKTPFHCTDRTPSSVGRPRSAANTAAVVVARFCRRCFVVVVTWRNRSVRQHGGFCRSLRINDVLVLFVCCRRWHCVRARVVASPSSHQCQTNWKLLSLYQPLTLGHPLLPHGYIY